MILDLQSMLSDKQRIGIGSTGTAVSGTTDGTIWSTNFIDLGDYSSADSMGVRNQGRIAGYPAKVGATAGTADYIGRQPYAHRLGASNLPFFGVVNSRIFRPSDLTSFTVSFCVGDAGPSTPEQASDPAGHEVITSVTLPLTSVDISGSNRDVVEKGTQIPWPSIPRYLTKRYFYLLYTVTGGSGGIGGVISAGFTPHIASEL